MQTLQLMLIFRTSGRLPVEKVGEILNNCGFFHLKHLKSDHKPYGIFFKLFSTCVVFNSARLILYLCRIIKLSRCQRKWLFIHFNLQNHELTQNTYDTNANTYVSDFTCTLLHLNLHIILFTIGFYKVQSLLECLS